MATFKNGVEVIPTTTATVTAGNTQVTVNYPFAGVAPQDEYGLAYYITDATLTSFKINLQAAQAVNAVFIIIAT